MSFSYVSDVVDVLRQLAEKLVQGESVPTRLNVAGPEAISVRRFAHALGAALGRDPVLEVTDRQRPFDLVADISLLESLVDISFTPFEEAIALSVE